MQKRKILHCRNNNLFADDLVLLASSNRDLQFVAECEAAGMRNTGTYLSSEAAVLCWKRVECPFWIENEFLSEVKQFKAASIP